MGYGHKMSYNLRTDVLDNETYDEYHTRRVEVEIEIQITAGGW